MAFRLSDRTSFTGIPCRWVCVNRCSRSRPDAVSRCEPGAFPAKALMIAYNLPIAGVLAFKGKRGTLNMIEWAEKAGIPVKRIGW